MKIIEIRQITINYVNNNFKKSANIWQTNNTMFRLFRKVNKEILILSDRENTALR